MTLRRTDGIEVGQTDGNADLGALEETNDGQKDGKEEGHTDGRREVILIGFGFTVGSG